MAEVAGSIRMKVADDARLRAQVAAESAGADRERLGRHLPTCARAAAS